MKKLIILANFFFLACLDLFIVKNLFCTVGGSFGVKFLIAPAIQTILQIVLIFGVYYWTNNAELTLTTVIFSVSGVEDCFFFLLDFLITKTIPTGEFWWMSQYHIFGTWNLRLHLFWAFFWLFFASALGKLKTRA